MKKILVFIFLLLYCFITVANNSVMGFFTEHKKQVQSVYSCHETKDTSSSHECCFDTKVFQNFAILSSSQKGKHKKDFPGKIIFHVDLATDTISFSGRNIYAHSPPKGEIPIFLKSSYPYLIGIIQLQV